MLISTSGRIPLLHKQVGRAHEMRSAYLFVWIFWEKFFCESQSHTFSCEHEKYDLLTLVSCKYGNIKSKEKIACIIAIYYVIINFGG